MERVTAFNPQQLEAISRILADTGEGLTGAQIGYILRDCGMLDPSPEMTKWKRLFNAFIESQNRKQMGNHVLMFVNRAMNPVTYTTSPDAFTARQSRLNAVLAFTGMMVGDDGKVRRATVATDLTDAIARADRLYKVLATRKVHDDVLRFCRAELVQRNYFHAVFEAMKS